MLAGEDCEATINAAYVLGDGDDEPMRDSIAGAWRSISDCFPQEAEGGCCLTVSLSP